MRKGARRRGEQVLYGAKESSETLGVTQSNLRTLAGLPEPYDAVAGTTLWRAEEIEAFAKVLAKRRKKANGKLKDRRRK